METSEVVVLGVFVLIVLVFAGVMVGDSIKERIRRKKHSKWYKLYNRALSNSLCIGGKFQERAKNIGKRIELVQDHYLNGKCTEDEYGEAMKTITKEYSDAVKWYKLNRELLGVEADLKEADAYAKEHNLKWGIIYE